MVKEAELVTNPNVDVSLQIGLNDVVAISVAKYEREMRLEHKQLTSEVNALQVERDQHLRDMQVLAERVATKKYAVTLTHVTNSIQALKLKPAPEFQVQITVQMGVSQKVKNKTTKVIGYLVSLKVGGWLLGHVWFKYDGKLRKLESKVTQLNEAATAKVARVAEILKQLEDMPAIERQVRAQITQDQLETSTAGQRLLKSVQTGLGNANGLLGLPQY